ncbi:MAG TPA: helix-turn-helix transcriptional regulator, partial [Anaerolineales bacterium]|nr:helix-turn-helix transcriptional regulator [Anaerolineales bacterium]
MDDLALHFELANAVLRARLQKGWTQSDLAKAVGTKQANISKIEAGLANPTLALVRKITRALGLEVWVVAKQPTPGVQYSTDISNTSDHIGIFQPYWPAAGLDMPVKVISDSSAEDEGYHV